MSDYENKENEEKEPEQLTKEVCDQIMEILENAVSVSVENLYLFVNDLAGRASSTGYEPLLDFYVDTIDYGHFDFPSASGRFRNLAKTDNEKERADSLEEAIDKVMEDYEMSRHSGRAGSAPHGLNISDDDFEKIRNCIQYYGAYMCYPFQEASAKGNNDFEKEFESLMKEFSESIEMFIARVEYGLVSYENDFKRGVRSVRSAAESQSARGYHGKLPGWLD